MAVPTAVARARTRVAMLKAAYREAVERTEACAKEMRDVELPFADGQQQYRNALQAESAALHAYTQAIHDLAALTKSR